MANKQPIKKSEARILVYLYTVVKPLRYMTAISTKLDIDYGYVQQLLRGMVTKGWLVRFKTKGNNKVFFALTRNGQKQNKIAHDKITGGK